VETERRIASKLIREKLQLEGPDTEVIQIKRVRYLKDKRFTFSTNYLPLDIGGRIKEKMLYEKSLLQVLGQDLGIQFTEAVQTIEASFADHDVAEHLAIPSGSPILFVERIIYAKQRPIEIFQSAYPGDLYKFIVRYKNVIKKDGSEWIHQSG
jgi:GntR family transcriptional regulator